MADTDDIGSIVEYSEDVSEAEAPEVLPSGTYEAEIRGVTAKIGTSSGKKYAAVDFYIPVDQFPADYPVENNPDGLTVTYRMVSLEDNPRARYRMRKFCEAIGAKPGRQIDLNEWVGLTCRVDVSKEQFEGMDREIIAKVKSLD